jgi:ABC-2 type transport system ATP-binding protein
MTRPSIETRKLTKQFGSFTALNGLDLKIEGAKCVGFLGPNGAGKTTTLKMLTDMIFPTSGECFVNDIPVRKDRKSALAYCGVLIESPEIYPSLTPMEMLDMAGRLRGLAPETRRARSEEVLAEVKMGDWADKKVGKFSKGMKQRVNIAATLLHDPQVLMLDEPATGLDPRGMAEVRDIVRGLKKRNRLIFMSSHILPEVTDVCDEVALINKGQLLFYDTLEAITRRFGDGHSTVDVAFARNVSDSEMSGRIAAVKGVVGAERLDARRIRLRFEGGVEEQSSICESVAALGLGLASFQESKSALEEIYLNQIERGD